MVQCSTFLDLVYCVQVLHFSGSEEGGGELVFPNTLTQTELSGQQLSDEMDVSSVRGLRVC